MRDPRLTKLAEVLVRYSTAVKPGDLVRIAGNPTAEPLLVEVYRQALAAGANPVLRIRPEECQEILLAEGSEEQLRFEDPLGQHEIETVDVTIGAWGEANTKALSRVDPKRQGLVSQARRKFMAAFLKRAGERGCREFLWIQLRLRSARPPDLLQVDSRRAIATRKRRLGSHPGRLARRGGAHPWTDPARIAAVLPLGTPMVLGRPRARRPGEGSERPADA